MSPSFLARNSLLYPYFHARLIQCFSCPQYRWGNLSEMQFQYVSSRSKSNDGFPFSYPLPGHSPHTVPCLLLQFYPTSFQSPQSFPFLFLHPLPQVSPSNLNTLKLFPTSRPLYLLVLPPDFNQLLYILHISTQFHLLGEASPYHPPVFIFIAFTS